MRRLAHLCSLAAALTFALTFFDVVYRGNSLIHFTGQELVTGTTFHHPFQIGAATIEIGHVPALPAAGVALAALAMAAGLSWMKGRAGNALALVLDGAAATCLLLMRSQVASVIAPRFPEADIRYALAYWCALLLAWSGMLLSLAVLLRKAEKSAP